MHISRILFPAAAALALAGCSTSRPGCTATDVPSACTCGPACACCPAAACGNTDPVIGSWGLQLPYDRMSAGHVIFSREKDGAPKAFCLHRWASPVSCRDVKIDGRAFSFVHPSGQAYRGTVCGDRLYGEVTPLDAKGGGSNGETRRFEGWRNPPIELANTEDAQFGEAIDLLKDGLDGWQLMDPAAKNGWTFKDGVLSNKLGRKPDGKWAGGGSNLRTKRADFYDFNLEYDVRVPTNSNSGVYLRGRYEIQTVDSFRKPTDCHAMAAYYGRVAPSVAAERRPGEWQHVSVTLYKRHLSVILNRALVIHNVPVTGVTGGAIDAHEFATGPIYLQGDHSDADYRNMILRPVVK